MSLSHSLCYRLFDCGCCISTSHSLWLCNLNVGVASDLTLMRLAANLANIK